MKKYRSVYLFVAVLTVAGSGLVLADAGQSIAAGDYRAAMQCADSSSGHCYQLYPGVINSVRVTQTSSGQRDEVNIASQKTSIHVSLKPTVSEAAMVQAGAAVGVEWYVGSVTAVWIGGHGIRSTSSPLNHADFAYVGWMLIWLAAFLGGVMLLSRKLADAFASPWVSALKEKVLGLAGDQVALPGGTIGWSIGPRLSEVVVLPLVFTVVALVSIRPFMNPDRRLIASISDLLLFGAIVVGLTLTLRNCRVMADPSSLMKVDRLGRMRSWPLSLVDQAAAFTLRGPYTGIPCLTLIGHDGSELFTVSSLFWDVDEIEALCVRIGIPVNYDYYLTRDRPVNWKVRAMVFAIGLVSSAVMAWSFLPMPQ
jgi:hypothetical protein